jgi:aminoglycoside phosphotransferase (APT) family kinase protein
MGEVYLARDKRLDRCVALKVLPSRLNTDPDRVSRFLQEARAASALTHPNVAVIYDIGESEGISFIAMEYVEGHTLAEAMLGEPMATREIVDIGSQVADALQSAHSKRCVPSGREARESDDDVRRDRQSAGFRTGQDREIGRRHSRRERNASRSKRAEYRDGHSRLHESGTGDRSRD